MKKSFMLTEDEMNEAFALLLASQGRMPPMALRDPKAKIQFEIKHDGEEVEYAKVDVTFREDPS